MGKVSTVNPFLGVAGGSNSKRRGGEWFVHRVVTTTGGTVDAANSDPIAESRITVTKTAATAGRYTITLPDKYRKFGGALVTLIGPDTANWGANTLGFKYFFRDNDIDGSALDGTLELQFVQTSAADAELPDGVIFLVMLLAFRGS